MCLTSGCKLQNYRHSLWFHSQTAFHWKHQTPTFTNRDTQEMSFCVVLFSE